MTNHFADKYHTDHLKEKDDTLDYSSDYKKGKEVRSYRLNTGYMPVDIEAKIEGRYVMPEIDEVLKMAKGKKKPMEIKRCVEFFWTVQPEDTKKAKHSFFQNDF